MPERWERPTPEIRYPQAVENRELTSREIDGLVVTLFFRQGTMPPETFVAVHDNRTGDHFQVETPPGVSPNHVFNHPYVYRQEHYRPAA